MLLADKIIVLDQGRISAVGSHRQLLEESAVYRDIYRSQLGEPPAARGSGMAEGSGRQPAAVRLSGLPGPGGRGPGRHSTERPKDVRGALRRLLAYLRP